MPATSETDQVTCYEMLPQKPPRRWRKALGYFAIRAGDGTVFLPGIVAGTSMEIFLCAGYDRTSIVAMKGTLLYPAAWLAREFPRCADAVAHVVECIRERHPEATAVPRRQYAGDE